MAPIPSQHLSPARQNPRPKSPLSLPPLGPLSLTFLLGATPTVGAEDIISLRLHAAYIRDTLVPLLTPSPDSTSPELPLQESYLLASIIQKISRIPITVSTLSETRIERALKVVIDSNLRWPADVVRQSRYLLRKWERDVGFSLKNVRADLFGPRGRLEGLVPALGPVRSGDPFVVTDQNTGIPLSLTGPPNETAPYRTGHLHLTPGDWWVNTAALYRDAVVSHPERGGLTYDRDMAYAIVVECAADEEPAGPEHGRRRIRGGFDGRQLKYGLNGEQGQVGTLVRYKVSRKDLRVGKGVFKLMRTMASMDQSKKVVRVFRSSKGAIKGAGPSAGVRYEGLYRLISYSIKLLPPNGWTYIFTLVREETQPSYSTITHVPISEQVDDWHDYQALADSAKSPLIVTRIPPGVGVHNILDEKRQGQSDGGYFDLKTV